VRTTYRPACAKRSTWPDTQRWAAEFAASPAVTAQDRRHREIVADLLAQTGGA
jgi:endogenous inhibitor of DNA gyrase (YacG/DUF329 family)